MSSEHDFFSQTLKLHQEYDFSAVLEKAGLAPSTTTEYNVSTFHSLHSATVALKFNNACTHPTLLLFSITGSHQLLQFIILHLPSLNTHNDTMQNDEFEKAFETSLGVKPLLECLYSPVGANRKCIFVCIHRITVYSTQWHDNHFVKLYI